MIHRADSDFLSRDVLPAAKAIEAFLGRHLGDEEDLAVPILLHRGLRG